MRRNIYVKDEDVAGFDAAVAAMERDGVSLSAVITSLLKEHSGFWPKGKIAKSKAAKKGISK